MPQTEQLNLIEQACQELLARNPEGISEFQLLTLLRAEEYALFPPLSADDHLGLFHSHFLLFHVLYRLRDRLLAEQRGVLQISALHIALGDYYSEHAALAEGDPLRDYYLDLNYLTTTDETDVLGLLSDFWRRMQLGEPERIRAAQEVLELETVDDFEQVKAQYRRLVMQHHPDRGGEAARMHELNDALEVLRIYCR